MTKRVLQLVKQSASNSVLVSEKYVLVPKEGSGIILRESNICNTCLTSFKHETVFNMVTERHSTVNYMEEYPTSCC